MMTKLDQLKERIAALQEDEVSLEQLVAIGAILSGSGVVHSARIVVPTGWYLYAENPEIKAILPDQPHLAITGCEIETERSQDTLLIDANPTKEAK